MNIKTLIDEKEIQDRIKIVADKIQKDYDNEEIVIVCILKGAAFFFSLLTKRMNSPIVMDFMKVSSYEGTESSGEINFTLDISTDIQNKNVVIVEDIIDTGRTLKYLKEYLTKKSPKSLKICTLLNKKERRVVDLEPDYLCFDIPDKFVIGYGLDYDEKYRNLQYIGFIE